MALIKGIWLTIYYGYGLISFSKEGIYYLLDRVSRKTIYLLLLARLIALVNVVLFLVIFPFSIIIYFVLFVCAMISLVTLFPLSFCTEYLANFIKLEKKYFIGCLISLLLVFANLLLLPLEVLFPEVTIMILKTHTWGVRLQL